MKPKPQKEKKFVERKATLAAGGDTEMFGVGDRTKTPTADSAGQQTAGRTGQKSKSNRKFAEGGSPHGMVKEQAADPAPPGRTAKPHSAALGGEARPAKPGQTGC